MNNKHETNDSNHPKDGDESFTKHDLIEQLEYSVNYFHRLPKHEKFSFVTQADLYHLMVLVVNILKIKGNKP
jgi:hypothetical protein